MSPLLHVVGHNEAPGTQMNKYGILKDIQHIFPDMLATCAVIFNKQIV